MYRQVERGNLPTLWQDAVQGIAAYAVVALLPLTLMYGLFPN